MSFAENIIGSFIEIGCTILLMGLFSPTYLANKCKTCVAIGVLALLSGCTGLLESPIADMGLYISLVLLFSIMLKRPISTVLFEFLLSVAFFMCIEYIFITIFFQMQGTESLLFINRLVQLILTLGICITIGTNKQLSRLIRNTYTLYQQEIQFIAVVVFTFIIAEIYLWKTGEVVVLDTSIVVLVFITICFFISILFFKKLIENRKQKENLRLQTQYMEMTENLLDSLYAEKHDFNKHLQAIQGMCQTEAPQNAVDEITKYIDTLQQEKNMKRGSNESANTGKGIVNALVYSKHREAKKRNISFSLVPNGNFPRFPCEDYELVQIIANLVDNAFDAVEDLPIETRSVILCINQLGHKGTIEVRNAYNDSINIKNMPFETSPKTTKFGERRGYGLQIVKALTQKYHGKFDISKEGNEFVARVLL